MTHLPTPIKKKKKDLLTICNHSIHFNIIFTDSRTTETFFPHWKSFSKDTGLKNLRSRFFLNWLLYQIQYFQSFIITEEDLFKNYGSLQRLFRLPTGGGPAAARAGPPLPPGPLPSGGRPWVWILNFLSNTHQVVGLEAVLPVATTWVPGREVIGCCQLLS